MVKGTIELYGKPSFSLLIKVGDLERHTDLSSYRPDPTLKMETNKRYTVELTQKYLWGDIIDFPRFKLGSVVYGRVR